ncbi:hypothetical protein TNCV_1026071 [Trichonephila clavipes]|nr:hypothetical protein TNCV_1026071 [Trichonephila clavipes]
MVSLFSVTPYRRYQLSEVILTPNFLPRGRHLSSDDANLYEFKFAESIKVKKARKGYFSCCIIIRHGSCRFSASGKSTDLGRGRPRNLRCKRPVANQLRFPAGTLLLLLIMPPDRQ